jgi:hypothetical protein
MCIRRYARLLVHTPVWPAFGNHDFLSARPDTGMGPYFSAFSTPVDGRSGGVPSLVPSYYRWACRGMPPCTVPVAA